MKKIINLFFVFLVLFSSFSIPVKADDSVKYGIVNADIGINVRAGAGTTYEVLGDGISNRQVVTILENVNTTDNSTGCESGIWYKIKYLQVEEGVGYACSTYVNLLDSAIDSEFEAVLETFPESYRESLTILHKIYPNAVFRVYETGLDFNEVVAAESKLGKSLIWDNNNSRDGLKHLSSYDIKTNTFNNNYPGGGKNWYAASDDTIAYYVDPRNFLNEIRVFMFESLSYNSMYHEISGVEASLKSSFMYDAYVDGKEEKKFSSVIMEAGIRYGISPYYIASRIIQEVGTTRSDLVLGTYPSYPEFNGYYNFYNYGAGGENVVYNGLKYAYESGWNSEESAILLGAGLIGTNYISVGQDTNYFQKWDVICKSKYSKEYTSCKYYDHQYMQNIEAPYSEAAHTYDAYKKNLGNDMYNAAYVFTIPVYDNLPEKTMLPNSGNPINYLSSLIVNNNLVEGFDSLKSDYSITIPSNMKSINISATTLNKATISGTGVIEIKEDKQIIPITVTALNGSPRTYNITVNLNDDAFMNLNETLANIKSENIKDDLIIGVKKIDEIKNIFLSANSLASVSITDNKNVETNKVATGNKVILKVGEETKEYSIVVYGDTNGDGEVTAVDYSIVKNSIMGSYALEGAFKKAADVNYDGSVSAVDYSNIKNYIMGNESTIK